MSCTSWRLVQQRCQTRPNVLHKQTYFLRQCAKCSVAQQKQHSSSFWNMPFLFVQLMGGGGTSSQPSSRTVTFEVVSAEGERTPWLTAERVLLRLLCVCSLILKLFPAVNSCSSSGWQWPDTPDVAPDRLTPQTCGLLSRCNEIICYTSRSPKPRDLLAYRLGE